MGSVDHPGAFASSPLLETEALQHVSESEGCGIGHCSSSLESEWHSIPLEDPSFPVMDHCFHLNQINHNFNHSSKLEVSICGMSVTGGFHVSEETLALVAFPDGVRTDSSSVSVEASDGLNGAKEVRVSFRGMGDSADGAGDFVPQKVVNDDGAVVGYGDEGCLALVHHVRAFIKGAKLSCGGLLSGECKTFLIDGWSSLLQKSFSFRSSDGCEAGALAKKVESPVASRSTPSLMLATKIPVCDRTVDTHKPGPLQARDPQARAEALPLAHYRPTDGPTRKEGEVTPSVSLSKPPVHSNCKKPPKPPRHPGRVSPLDSSGSLAAQRCPRKSRDRVSSKRKARITSASPSTGFTPLVALVLTLGFGMLMVFQGAFVQTNVSHGRNSAGAFVDATSNTQSFLASQRAASYARAYQMDLRLSGLSTAIASRTEGVVSNAFHKSMQDLPWSRSSMISQVTTDST